jgi:undecaprenyl pyrophosphate phosphatase UppP
MPTNTERVDEVTALAQRLLVQVEAVQADIKRLTAQHDQDVQALEEVKTAGQKAAIEAAVVVHRVTELEKHRELWSLRWWQIGLGILVAVVGGVIGYLLKR